MKSDVNKFAEVVAKLHLKALEFKQLTEVLDNPKDANLKELLHKLEQNLQQTKLLKKQLYDIYKQENQ